MVPGLRVLVAGALDPNVPVRNQQLDVAAAGVEAVVDGAVLVFRYVVCNPLLIGWRLCGKQTSRSCRLDRS